MGNVVYITVDSLRADYVIGPNAPDSLETLPKLADRGLNFTTAYSDAPYTKQSFLSILSGTYPWMFDAQQGGFEHDRPHIAEILSEAGYSTGGFHTNTYLSPTYNYDRGFDFYLGRDASTEEETYGITETAYNTLVERAVATKGIADVVYQVYETAGKRFGIQLGSSLYKPAEQLNDAIVDWTRTASEPAFVWAHYMDVHNPYYPREGTVSEGISRRKAVKLYHKVNDLGEDAPAADIETLETLYKGEIEYFDRQLGDLLDRLDGTIGLEETLVVFSSDHGEAFNEKGLVFHPGDALYDENVRVPIILDGPNIEPGEVETPVANVDLVATILARIGVDAPASLVGEDISEFGRRPPDDRFVFTESFSRDDGSVMVTDGRFKLIRDLETGEQTLYDRHEQPAEIHGCADEYPEVRDELDSALDRHIRFVRETEPGDTDVEVTEDVRLQLKKLGYDE